MMCNTPGRVPAVPEKYRISAVVTFEAAVLLAPLTVTPEPLTATVIVGVAPRAVT